MPFGKDPLGKDPVASALEFMAEETDTDLVRIIMPEESGQKLLSNKYS